MRQQYTNIYLALAGEIMGETEKAIKFKVLMDDDTFKIEWFPLSQIASIHRTHDEINLVPDVLMASEWILKQKFMHHLASTKNPVMSNVPSASTAASAPTKSVHPPVPTTPPAKSFVDMDDDIPF